MLAAREAGVFTGARDPMRAELLHEPYFSALAALEGHEGESDWRALIAGLVALRLADRRMASAAYSTLHTPPLDPETRLMTEVPPGAIEVAQAAADAVDDHDSVARPLRELVRSANAANAADLPERLLAYGHALHADSRWALAADVYRTVLRFAEAPGPDGPPTTQVIAPYAYDRLGRSLRLTGDLEGASAAYAAARSAAHVLGDDYANHLIRISQAKIPMHLGNLPAAAAALDAIIRDAAMTRLSKRRLGKTSKPFRARDRAEIIAFARHDRGLIATLQHEFNLATEHYFAAWQSYRDADRRERVWADLALNFAEMGRHDIAREAFLVLFATARTREIRHIAAINLLELAVLDGQEHSFENYRRILHEAERDGSLPAEVAAKFALYEGRGNTRFGRPDAALRSFERALAIATRHRINEVTIRADEAIAALRTGRPIADWVVRTVAVSFTSSVERITRVVRRARRSTAAVPS